MRRVILGVVSVTVLLVGVGAARPGAQPQPITVDIQDFSFQPHELRVNVGTAVRWVNRDSEVPHEIVAEDGKTVRSPLVQPRQDFSFVFNQPGQARIDAGCVPRC